METRLAALTQRATFRAVDDSIACTRFLFALGMRAVLGAFVGIKRPLNPVVGETMPLVRTRVIEHDRILLAGRRPKHATDHLAIQTELPGGARKDATAN